MSYQTVILKDGPLDGERQPVIPNRTPVYGFMLQLPFSEVISAQSATGLSAWTQRVERIAIYKCQGDVCGEGESTATFVGVLR